MYSLCKVTDEWQHSVHSASSSYFQSLYLPLLTFCTLSVDEDCSYHRITWSASPFCMRSYCRAIYSSVNNGIYPALTNACWYFSTICWHLLKNSELAPWIGMFVYMLIGQPPYLHLLWPPVATCGQPPPLTVAPCGTVTHARVAFASSTLLMDQN